VAALAWRPSRPRSYSTFHAIKVEAIVGGETVGQVIIAGVKLQEESTYAVTKWPLEGPERGAIRLQVKKSLVTVLDDSNYDALFALLIENNMDLVKMMLMLNDANPGPIADSLVKVFERRSTAVHFIKTIVGEQIRQTCALPPPPPPPSLRSPPPPQPTPRSSSAPTRWRPRPSTRSCGCWRSRTCTR